jgi:serine/threonine protein kinase
MARRYDLLEQLGEGGAGAVYKAWDTRLQRYVAIKQLHPPEKREGEGVGTDLGKEAAALSSLQHPNIVSVYDLDELDGEPCVIMEFLNGETLEQTMRRGALTQGDFASVARQSLEGLVAAHRLGVQHRDIKPSNIMVSWLPNGDFLVKMLDFGLADFTSRPHQEQKNDEDSAYGSVHFMAPEQFTRRPVDARTDLYSLGCVFYYALTAAFPFDGKKMDDIIQGHLKQEPQPLHRLRADVPVIVSDWVLWLMQKDPEHRPASAEEALETFRQIQAGTLRQIPRKRSLKTQPVKTTSGTGKIPPSADHPARTAPVNKGPRAPVPGTLTAEAAPRATVAGASARKPFFTQKTLLYLAISLVGIVFAVVLANLLSSPKPSAELPAAKTLVPPIPDPYLWVHSEFGVKKDRGKTPATQGDKVDIWEDLAELGGGNHLQYVFTRSTEEQRLVRLPIFSEVMLQGKSKPVISFRGQHTLLLASDEMDRRETAMPSGIEVHTADYQTYAFIFKADYTDDKMMLLGSSGATQSWLWVLFWEKGGFTMITSTSVANVVRLGCKLDGKFCAVFITQSVKDKKAQIFYTNSSGTTQSSAVSTWLPPLEPIARLRFGAPGKLSTTGNMHFLKADVAEVFYWPRTVSQAEREAFQTYFLKNYRE